MFHNHYPDDLDEELSSARELGVEPVRPGTAEFDSVISSGTVKWAVNENGSLAVIPKFVDREELYHPVLAGGGPVQAAGEADIVGSAESGYYGTEINNYSGHYLPSPESLEIGEEAFQRHGINFAYSETVDW